MFELIFEILIIVSIVLAFTAYKDSKKTRREVDFLKREVARLRGEPGKRSVYAEQAAPPKDEIRAAPEVPEQPVASEKPEPSPYQKSSVAVKKKELEELFASRWLVWLGSATLALGAVFMVKYSIDLGLLSPSVRCVLGGIMGISLTLGGEWLRRRPLSKSLIAFEPSQIPPALSAAGISAMYATVYAAFALYGLIGPLFTFTLLAGISLGAVGLSLLQGPLIAAIGLLGGFVVPMLVSSDKPSALALFAYLLFLISGSLAVVRYRPWKWLAWMALAGGGLWPFMWFGTAWSPGDTPVLSAYLLAIMGLFAYLTRGFKTTLQDAPLTLKALFDGMAANDWVVWGAAWTVSFLMFLLVRGDSYSFQTLVAVGFLCVLYFFIGRRESNFDLFCVLALMMMTALLFTWHIPEIIAANYSHTDGEPFNFALFHGPVVPPELVPFTVTSVIVGALFAVGGFALLWGAVRPAVWASVSVAAPIAVLIVAFWRITNFEVSLMWSSISLGVAAVYIMAAQRISARHRDPGMDGALGAYAIGVVALVSLAASMALEQAWLTVALALQLPALAWINSKLSLKALRWVALIIAGAVLVRLALNYNILDYPLGEVPGLNWIVYGYGIPLAAFYLAARQFRKSGDDVLVMVLDAGSIVFGVLLVTFEIRNLVAGSLDSPHYSMLERSLQIAAWLGISLGLLYGYGRNKRRVSNWGWRFLSVTAAVKILFLQCFFANPIFTGDPVGQWPVINLLLLAYAVPGVFAALFSLELARQGRRKIALFAGGMALLLFIIEISLEVRHGFHGSVLSQGETSELEWYSYSVAWLAYAGVLLAVGMWKASKIIRHAALSVLLLVVAKVFLSDMAALEGMYRALSFLGLGASLVAIGYLYQRFVYPPKAQKLTGS